MEKTEILGVEYYTTVGAAKILSVSKQSIMNWIWAGTIKASRIGKRWLIPKESIENYIVSKEN